MDDDFDDCSYYRKPRMQLAAGGNSAAEADEQVPAPTQSATALFCGVGVALLALALCTADVAQFVALWCGVAFIVGPFSPRRITGGDCRVGIGAELEEPEEEGEEVEPGSGPARGKRDVKGKSGTRGTLASSQKADAAEALMQNGDVSGGDEWTRHDWDQLRKLLVKFPRGTPQRWEAVARALGGKRATEEVIKASKVMAEEGGGKKDAFAAFIAEQRKSAELQNKSQGTKAPLVGPGTKDKFSNVPKVASATNLASAANKQPPANGGVAAQSSVGTAAGVGGGVWSESADVALLQALKECPKESSLRWDRVAAAMPGFSKQQCFQRFSELRSTFRSNKGAVAQADSSLAELADPE